MIENETFENNFRANDVDINLKSSANETNTTLSGMEKELNRLKTKQRKRSVVKNTIFTLAVVAAFAVIVAILFMPVLRIYGTSMTPTFQPGDIVVTIKGSEVEKGDIIGAYYGNKLLIKRCIASEQEWVDIDPEGNIYVNDVMVEEPYIKEKDFGETNIKLPYQVPDNSIFVVGDHRAVSIDSRNTSVGCIERNNIVGKIVFRIWPISRFGPVNAKEVIE